MKIASVTFHGKHEQIGGAQIPAIAFKEWCDILGYECDYVAYDENTNLDKYNSIFFCTPPPLCVVKGLRSDVKFVSMIHAEFDDYEKESMELSEAVVVIDDDKWCFDNQIKWHPCTLPKYLLKGDECFNIHKEGTIYAARLSTWKNANTLCAISNIDSIRNKLEPIHIYGKANKSDFGHYINSSLSRCTRGDGIYNIDDMQNKLSKAKYFWDVSGTNDYKLDIKRLNLSAFEAMKQGCIPIVNMDSIPDVLKSFCIDFRKIDLKYDLEQMKANMLLKAKTEYFGYEQVKKQVKKIIKELL